MRLENQRRTDRRTVRLCIVLLLLIVSLVLPGDRANSAFTVPAGFTDSLAVSGLSSPTAMEFAPDGRLFVCEQGGALRVIKNGALLATPFLTVTVDSNGERGLLGVAFDPNFPSSPYVYIYYTSPTPAVHNRVSRFTANGDASSPGSEVVLLELDNLSGATNHNGGAIHFGPDGHLYVAVGDNANSANAQSLSTLHGKMLRIRSDGVIPADNPFNAQTTGNRKAIWAMGLRNPFTFSFKPSAGRMFINDVGQSTWEEINDGIAGSNYGWSICEGICNPPNANLRDPIYQYSNDASTCAITGGVFYNPTTVQFPVSFLGTYFFADFCGGWIRNLDPANGNSVAGFAASISPAVDLKVSSGGSLYYLTRDGGGAIRRIDYPANMLAPAVNTHPGNQTVGVGESATFSVGVSGTPPFTYQWQRNDVDIVGANSASYTLTGAQQSDSGATFRAIVTNSFGSVTSNSAALTVSITPLEADVAPRPTGSGGVIVSDWVQVGRFSVGLDIPAPGSEFQRADCAPRAALGDGQISVADWVQAGRYSVGLDPVVAPGGPTSASASAEPAGNRRMSTNSEQPARTVLRAVNAEFKRDEIGALHIELDALGNESALGFTLNYDAGTVVYVDAVLPEANNGRLLVNAKRVRDGRLGIALALPGGRTFAAGTHRLLTLRFVPLTRGGPAVMRVGFDDSIIEREVVSGDAVRLPSPAFISATVKIDGAMTGLASLRAW